MEDLWEVRRDRISPFDRSALRRSVKETLGVGVDVDVDVGVGDSEVGRVIDPEEEADRSSVPTDWRPPRNTGGCRASRSIRGGARPSRVTCVVPTESRWYERPPRTWGIRGLRKIRVGIFAKRRKRKEACPWSARDARGLHLFPTVRE